MNLIGRLMASVAATLFGAGGAVGAAGAANAGLEAAWSNTLKDNTLAAYAQFVMQYPDSEYATVAFSKLAADGLAASDIAQTAPEQLAGAESPQSGRTDQIPFLYVI